MSSDTRTRVSLPGMTIEADGPITITFGEQEQPDLIPNTDEQYDLGPSATPLKPTDHSLPYKCLYCELSFDWSTERKEHYEKVHWAKGEPMVEKAKKKTRKAKGHRQVCAHCRTTFIAHTQRTRFCCDRHRHAWLRTRGYTYPLPKPVAELVDAADDLTIKAGATGVSIKEGK